MKKFIVFAAACLVAFSFLLIVQPASAATGPVAWEPTNTDVNLIHLNISFGETVSYFNFGIYDWGVTDISSSAVELFDGTVGGFAEVDMTISGDSTNGYTATITGGSSNGQTLDLGNDYLFGFYFGEYATNYEYIKVPNTLSTYSLSLNGTEYFSIDAKPVPIPTTLFLLGSGLVGLVGFKRRNR